RLILEKLARDNPAVNDYWHKLAYVYYSLGALLTAGERPAEALSWCEKARDLQQQLVRHDERVTAYRRDLAVTYGQIAALQRGAGRREEALASLGKARDLLEPLARAHPDTPDLGRDLARVLAALGATLELLGRPDEALAAYRQGVAVLEPAYARAPQIAEYRRNLAGLYAALAARYRATGRRAEQEAAARRCARLCPGCGADLYRQVCETVQLSLKVGRDQGVPAEDRARRQASYAEEAVYVLRQAVACGFRDAERLRRDPALEPLRSRADFQQLLAGLGG